MTGSVINRPLIRYVAIAATFVGTIQAVIWIFLSLIPILFYTEVIEPNTNISTVSYQYFLYNLFLAPDIITSDEVIVTTKVFNIFMYVYLALSVLWLPVSLYVLWAMTKDKWKDSTSFIGGWAGLTLLISAFDLVVMCLLAADYVTISDLLTNEKYTQLLNTSQSVTDSAVDILETTTSLVSPSPDLSASRTYELFTGLVAMDSSGVVTIYDFIQQIINTSYILVITLAVRGYILWIVNVTFAFFLINFAIALSKDAKKSLLPLIDNYSTGRSPWTSNLYEQTDIGNGYSNQAYVGDNDREVFPRSDSFISGEPEMKSQNPLSSGSNPYAQQMEKLRPVPTNPNLVSPKVAKIGKQSGRRTPPRNVPPPNIPQSNLPYIPDPDYSPPGSPRKPKSALRPRSNYVL